MSAVLPSSHLLPFSPSHPTTAVFKSALTPINELTFVILAVVCLGVYACS